jgi:hypothetical protein
VAFVGDSLYVVGGWELRDGQENWLKTMAVLDVSGARPAWQKVNVSFARRGVAAVALGEELAVIGGMDENDDVSASVDIYDPKRQEWRRGPDYPGDCFGAAAATDRGVVYASALDGAPDQIAVLRGIGDSSARTRAVEVIDMKERRPKISRLTLRNPGAHTPF